ncbi:hypothetical protein S83_019907, partial [Arachis hypogaea]
VLANKLPEVLDFSKELANLEPVAKSCCWEEPNRERRSPSHTPPPVTTVAETRTDSLFDQSSVLTSDGGFSSDNVSNLPKKGMDRGSHRSSSKLHMFKDSR